MEFHYTKGRVCGTTKGFDDYSQCQQEPDGQHVSHGLQVPFEGNRYVK